MVGNYCFNCLVDINECATGRDNCDMNALCINTDGSFQCICNDDFFRNGTTCSKSPYIAVYVAKCPVLEFMQFVFVCQWEFYCKGYM